MRSCRCSGLTSITIGNSVTKIESYAFYGCSGLTDLTIPSSVTSIGDRAFAGCSGLTSVTIPNSVTSIGSNAFDGTAWYKNHPDGMVYAGKVAYKYKGTIPSTITLEDGIVSIADWAFSNSNSLKSVTIPDGVTSIGDFAFNHCSSLTSITIPNSVTSIGNGAFADTPWYENQSGVVYVGKVAYAYKISGWEYYDEEYPISIWIKEGTIGIGDYFAYGISNPIEVYIPSSVAIIPNTAFSYCRGLTTVTVASGNRWYDSHSNCNAIIETASNTLIKGFRNTVIPSGVTRIGEYAFSGCSSLTEIIIPNSVRSIGNHAFYNCSGLTSLTIGDGVTSIGNYAFYGCSGLTALTIPNSVTSIEFDAFCNCSRLSEITFPNSVTSIGSNAFAGTPWYNNQPDGMVYADKVAYKYKGKMPDNTAIVLESGTVGIAEQAFYGCSGLTSLTIPNSVTTIGNNAFDRCSSLTSVTAQMTTPCNIYTSFIGNNCRLYVPRGTKEAYIAAGWTEYPFQGGIYEMGTTMDKGDVNGDGELNISDLTALVNMILGKSTKSSAADVNGDGEVDISDVTALVNMILGK